MIKCRFVVLFIATVLVTALCGCTVIREVQPRKESLTIKKQEYEIARNLLRAFVSDDGEAFVNLLPEETRTKFTVENFKNTRKAIVESVGEPVSYTYMTSLELPSLTPQIWKVRFRRTNVNKSKEFTSELLFRIITGMVSDKEAVITGFQFL